MSIEVVAPPPVTATATGPRRGAEPGRAGTGDPSWRRSGLVGLATWAGAAAMYVAVTALSFMIDDTRGPAMGRLYEVWDHWDTGHYMRIANVGYTPDRPDTHAFFPLYPLLLRGADTILPGPTLAATLVLANVLLIAALVVLHHFVTHEFGAQLADRTLLVLIAWPAAFFLSAGYNASLFLLLSVSALYCMRRGAWWAAGLLGALAGAARLAGVLLMLAFAVEYLRTHGGRLRGLRPDAAAILLIPAGLALFAGYLWWSLGDPLAFSRAQDFWGRRFAAPWVGFGEAVRAVGAQPLLEPVAVHNLIDVISAIVVVALLVLACVGPWRLRDEDRYLIVYSVASLLIVLTGPVAGMFPIQGVARYALELLPLFLVLGRLAESRLFERLYLLPAIGLQTVFLLTFLRNVWIA